MEDRDMQLATAIKQANAGTLISMAFIAPQSGLPTIQFTPAAMRAHFDESDPFDAGETLEKIYAAY